VGRSAVRAWRVRRGFTLVEVTAALAVGALVVLLAYRVYGGVLDGAARLLAAQQDVARSANARRQLTALAQGIEVGTVPGSAFQGSRTRVTFTTWTVGARGWPVRRRVSVFTSDGVLRVQGLAPEPLQFADSVESLGIDYLLDFGAAERWGQAWMSEVSTPVALRLRVARPGRTDTLLLLVGPRG
jgi:prepilin-type N-terminal cleavage/methylation domain-containing protein